MNIKDITLRIEELKRIGFNRVVVEEDELQSLLREYKQRYTATLTERMNALVKKLKLDEVEAEKIKVTGELANEFKEPYDATFLVLTEDEVETKTVNGKKYFFVRTT